MMLLICCALRDPPRACYQVVGGQQNMSVRLYVCGHEIVYSGRNRSRKIAGKDSLTPVGFYQHFMRARYNTK